MLSSLINQLGLNPKTRGERVSFWCPECDTQRRQNKRTAYGYNDEIGTWWCWRCMPRGTYKTARQLAKQYGLSVRGYTAQPRPKKEGAAKNIPLAWSELFKYRSLDLNMYWAIARGWPIQLVQYMRHHPDLMVASERPTGRSGLWLYNQCAPIQRRALIALRSDTGEVRNISRRISSLDEAGDLPKSMMLRRDDTGGHWVCFGRIPSINSKSRVVLVEGGPDYLCAGYLWPGYVVVGAVNATAMIETAAKIGRRKPKEVTIIPHIGDTPRPGESIGIGEACAQSAAEILKNYSSVRISRLPGDGDLSDYLAQLGDSIRSLIRQPLLYKKPLTLGESGDAMIVELHNAYAAARDQECIQTIDVPAGTGKTHAAISFTAEMAIKKYQAERDGKQIREGGRILFLAPNHQLAEEIHAQFAATYPQVKSRHIKGLPQQCRIWNPEAAKYYAAPGGGRKALCGMGKNRCEFWGECEGRKAKQLINGVNFSVHQMAHQSKNAHLTVIDEQPEAIQTTRIERDDVASLYRAQPFGRGRDWCETYGTAHLDTFIDIWGRCETWAIQQKTSNYGERAPLFDVVPRELIQRLIDSEVPAPPFPDPKALRKGLAVGDSMPSVQAFNALVVDAFDPLCSVELAAHRGGWCIEVRRPGKMPDGVAILLDATAEYTGEGLAKSTNRHIQRRVISIDGAAPKRSIWIDTDLYSAGSSLFRSSAKRLRRVVEWLRSEPTAGEIGIISHRRITEAGEELYPDIKWGYFGRDDRGTNRYRDIDTWVILGDPVPNIGAVQAECRAAGIEDWQRELRQRTYATGVQAIARARHIRRADNPPNVIYIGKYPPPVFEWVKDKIPNKTKRFNVAGLVGEIADQIGVVPSVNWLLSQSGLGWIEPLWDIDLSQISRVTIQRAVSKCARQRRCKEIYVADGRVRGLVYIRSEDDLARWADTGYAVPSPQNP